MKLPERPLGDWRPIVVEVGINYVCDRSHRPQTWKVRRQLSGPNAGETLMLPRPDRSLPEDATNPSGQSSFRMECPYPGCTTLVVYRPGTVARHLDEAEASYRAGDRRVLERSLL